MPDGQAFLNSLYVGINIQNILYGIELLLYFKTIHSLLSNGGVHKKSSLFYALFSSIMVFSITVWVAAQALFGQNIWLVGSHMPGGPYTYWGSHLSDWYLEWSRVQLLVLQLMTEALMIYRCRIIWNSNGVVIVPIILWLASLTLGILVAWTNSLQGLGVHVGIAMQVGLAYWSVSVFLNMVVTSMICYRVVRHGRKVQEYLGQEYASLYFTIAMVLVESVLPYTLAGVIFLVTLGVKSPTNRVFMCVYFLMMCISPQMLLLRMASGKAWDRSSFSRPCSDIKFDAGTMSKSRFCDSNGIELHSVTFSDGHGKAKIAEV